MIVKKRMHCLFYFISGLLFLGCTPFASGNINQNKLNLPSAYSKEVTERDNLKLSVLATDTFKSEEKWWKVFKSQDLNKLIDLALVSNFDILQAYARLEQSEASLKRAGADLFPDLKIAAESSRTRRSESLQAKGGSKISTDYALSLASGYELDLWGRISSDKEATLSRFKAGLEDIQTAKITVIANIVSTWLSILGTGEELAVLSKQIKTNRDLVELQLFRYSNGMSSGLDVLQQKELLAAAQAEFPVLENKLNILKSQLLILVGKFPAESLPVPFPVELPVDTLSARVSAPAFVSQGSLPTEQFAKLPELPPLPRLGLPSDLLFARPDIRSAWSNLLAAEWDVSQAKANMLPKLQLTGLGSVSGIETSTLFSNWLLTLVTNITIPLFDAGKLKSEVERNQAVVKEKAQVYAKVVAQALEEVENALSNELSQQDFLLKLDEQLTLAELGKQEVINSYLGGRDSFLRYITQLQNVQKLERNFVAQKINLILYRVTLYRALAGNF